MKFFSNCLIVGDRGTQFPAGERFKILSAGPYSPGVQGVPPRTTLHIQHHKFAEHIYVYDYHGRIVDEHAYVRYPALLGLATAMGYLIDLDKINAADLVDKEMQLIRYRSVTPCPTKVLDVTMEALDAYDRRDDMTHRLLTSYQATLDKFRSIFSDLTIRGDQHASQ